MGKEGGIVQGLSFTTKRVTLPYQVTAFLKDRQKGEIIEEKVYLNKLLSINNIFLQKNKIVIVGEVLLERGGTNRLSKSKMNLLIIDERDKKNGILIRNDVLRALLGTQGNTFVKPLGDGKVLVCGKKGYSFVCAELNEIIKSVLSGTRPTLYEARMALAPNEELNLDIKIKTKDVLFVPTAFDGDLLEGLFFIKLTPIENSGAWWEVKLAGSAIESRAVALYMLAKARSGGVVREPLRLESSSSTVVLWSKVKIVDGLALLVPDPTTILLNEKFMNKLFIYSTKKNKFIKLKFSDKFVNPLIGILDYVDSITDVTTDAEALKFLRIDEKIESKRYVFVEDHIPLDGTPSIRRIVGDGDAAAFCCGSAITWREPPLLEHAPSTFIYTTDYGVDVATAEGKWRLVARARKSLVFVERSYTWAPLFSEFKVLAVRG